MDNQYQYKTTDGRPARIICRDRKDPHFPVVVLIYDQESGLEVLTYLTDGLYASLYAKERGLEPFIREVSPWEEVKVDTPVYVKDSLDRVLRRHFAKYESGKVWVYRLGQTSFTYDGDLVDYYPHKAFLNKPE